MRASSFFYWVWFCVNCSACGGISDGANNPSETGGTSDSSDPGTTSTGGSSNHQTATGVVPMTNNVFIVGVSDTPGECLPRPLEVQTDGSVPCGLFSTTSTTNCSCSQVGQSVAPTNIIDGIRSLLKRDGVCGVSDVPDCTTYCVCKVNQVIGSSAQSCRNDATAPASISGWCYVTSTQDSAAYSPHTDCTKGALRIVNQEAPAAEQSLFIACPAQ